MSRKPLPSLEIVRRIAVSGLTIYDGLSHAPELYIPSAQLQEILQTKLLGVSLNYPLRTRSKVVKSAVCNALGYPVPDRFTRVRPRFPGQNFDIYVQKANNLQIWNEEVSQDRRYALIRLDESMQVTAVRVVSGEVIAALDTTGTLTQKYQAAARNPVDACVLASDTDTPHVLALLKYGTPTSSTGFGIPSTRFLPIEKLYANLKALAGQEFADPGLDQERNRGAALHQLVQQALGYDTRLDTGQFPDVPEQLLEIKLQTSPTIDLGLVSPNSLEPIELVPQARHCDVRYAVFYARSGQGKVRLDHVVVITGEQFFNYFRRFGGKEINRKLQIRLPEHFFSQTE